MSPDQQFILQLAAILAGVLVAAIGAAAAGWGARKSAGNSGKLDAIHILVNGNLAQMRDDLHTVRSALHAEGIADPTRPPPATP